MFAFDGKSRRIELLKAADKPKKAGTSRLAREVMGYLTCELEKCKEIPLKH